MWSIEDIKIMNRSDKLGKRWWKNLKSSFTMSFGECRAMSDKRDSSDAEISRVRKNTSSRQ